MGLAGGPGFQMGPVSISDKRGARRVFLPGGPLYPSCTTVQYACLRNKISKTTLFIVEKKLHYRVSQIIDNAVHFCIKPVLPYHIAPAVRNIQLKVRWWIICRVVDAVHRIVIERVRSTQSCPHTAGSTLCSGTDSGSDGRVQGGCTHITSALISHQAECLSLWCALIDSKDRQSQSLDKE